MKDKNLKGIALILFGILLCISSGELNNVVLLGVSYIPFSLFGTIFGIVGLILLFGKTKEKNS